MGGTYRNIALLRHIGQVVRDLGFEPIIPADYPAEFSDEEVHEASIELLMKCRWAIFEVSLPNGHMMEIERCHDLVGKGRMRVLLVWQVPKHDPEGDYPTASRMLLTGNFDKNAYCNFAELTRELAKFLQPSQ